MTHIELLKRSIDLLVDDGRYDKAELLELVDLALADGVVSDDEKRVLRDIFHTAQIGGIDTETQAWLTQIAKRYEI